MSIVHFPAEIMETSRSEGKLDGSRFNLREVENLVDKLQETFVVRVYDVIIRLPFFRIVAFGNEMRETYDSIQRRTYFMTHIGEEGRLQAIRHFRFLFRRLKFPFYHFQLRDVPFDADDDRRRQFVTVHPDFPFVEDNHVSVSVLSFSSPVQTFSGGSHLDIFLSLLFGYDRRVEIEVILADRVVLIKIAVVGLPIPVNVSEVVVDFLHYNPGREIVDGCIHDLVEPFDLGFVPNPLGNIMGKRPVTFFSGIIGHVVHRAFISQYTFIDFRWVMGHKVTAATVYDIFATFVPSLLCRHICGDIVNL